MLLPAPTAPSNLDLDLDMTVAATPSPPPCCPGCGVHQPELAAAQQRIADLEAQVRLLNQKAASAVDRWADYEDELSRMREQLKLSQPQPPPQQQQLLTPAASPSPTRPSFSLNALLTPRKSTPDLRPRPLPSSSSSIPQHQLQQLHQRTSSAGGFPPPSPTPSTPSSADLLEALSKEQSLRRAAEGRLSATSREVEELSAALFEQANEMVAGERRARARLEERVEVLERRDKEKRARLDRLEVAVGRIEKAREVLDRVGRREVRSVQSLESEG